MSINVFDGDEALGPASPLEARRSEAGVNALE